MKSLKFKIIFFIFMILSIILGAAFSIDILRQKTMIDSLNSEMASLVSGVIEKGLKADMLAQRREDINQILQDVSSEKGVSDIRVYGIDGVVKFSSSPDEIKKLEDKEIIKRAMKNGEFFMTTYKGEGRMTTLRPVMNESACYGCHNPSEKVRGIVEVNLSTKPFEKYISDTRGILLNSSLMTVIIVCLLIFVLFYAMVNKPLQKIIEGIKKIENGNLDEKIEIKTNVEMGYLAAHINNMARELKNQINSKIEKERELAKAQEKLLHHNKIEALNTQLLEHIKRLESANLKIKDLVEDVESKNYNLQKAVERLQTLNKTALSLSSVLELEHLFGTLLNNTLDAVRAEMGYILIYNEKLGKFSMPYSKGLGKTIDPEAYFDPTPGGVVEWVVSNCEPLLITDYGQNTRFERVGSLNYERKTLMCAPLISQGKVIGLITVANKVDESNFYHDELELFTTMSAQASFAIDNAKLYKSLQKNYFSTIQALINAIEEKDPYTKGHSDRVTSLCVALGREMGLPYESIRLLAHAGALHDIGKIGIDLNLIRKPGILTEHEKYIFQEHPTIGGRIIDPIEFLEKAKLCVAQHHERYDGLGYPNNLKGEEILFEARILNICDAYDAMTSDRPYRKALSREAAIAEIKKHRGTQFDPIIADAFLKMMETYEELAEHVEFPL